MMFVLDWAMEQYIETIRDESGGGWNYAKDKNMSPEGIGPVIVNNMRWT